MRAEDSEDPSDTYADGNESKNGILIRKKHYRSHEIWPKVRYFLIALLESMVCTHLA